MKKNLVERLLNEQTTPEEEHLVAKMLQQEEDMEQWLTEDETEAYDRIVGQRSARRHYMRWAIAAVIVLLIAAGAVVFWPREQVSDTVAEQKVKEESKPIATNVQPSVATTMPVKPAPNPRRTQRRTKRQATVNTTDSLHYYIARLEKELENVNESTYTAKAEEVLRADARLQKLVQRIMMGELTKDDVPAEAMNTNQTKEEQP